MVRSIVITGFLGITLLCVAAEHKDNELQAGYAAYQRQEYDTAIRSYEQALLASTDPGPIAYDLGAICAAAERIRKRQPGTPAALKMQVAFGEPSPRMDWRLP